ncbi:MAG: hypothetical protein HQK96_05945 [Nitrospirae bacterium]|nr:hypothetical protein [Nitrospirota bacterium]
MFIGQVLKFLGVDTGKVTKNIQKWSIYHASAEQRFLPLMESLRKIRPDLSEQYSSGKELHNEYKELKMRAMHAFQCVMMLKAIEYLSGEKLTVVDIGDSAGTHMLYLKHLAAKDIDTISVNLDTRAVEKIKSGGQNAILCRAEELDVAGWHIDLFTSFEMIEHLHNPALFFKRLAVKSSCNRMLITVPFVKKSRVGLGYIRNDFREKTHAEDVHLFELSPEDWTLLFLHSGWRVLNSGIYYQYPRSTPVISGLLSWFWAKVDFEGFWAAILEKDTTYLDMYQDWDE